MTVLYFLIDHGNHELDLVRQIITDKVGVTPCICLYDTSYLQTIRNIVSNIDRQEETTIWVCSSICDYSNFEFVLPFDGYNNTHFHVYPSDDLQQGDTFVFDFDTVETNLRITDNLEYLGIVNYDKSPISRFTAPTFKITADTQAAAAELEFNFPYAFCEIEPTENSAVPSLWFMPPIIVNSTGATHVTMPRLAQDFIETECYEYPRIITNVKSISKPLDVVFISNGEPDVEKNWNRLLEVTADHGNRITRVDGVNGRVQAYHAAALQSQTAWFFAVFAKLWVSEEFDWDWQPDRLQQSKHYIFQARNPVNELIYGHQAMIAYNRKLTLANSGIGLDFTLDSPHEVVDLLSGEARFNTDPWSTWRTAFREAIKLKADNTEISKSRLNTWRTVAVGAHAEWSIRGAKDGVEYYQQVSGNHDLLRLSYEWKWLQEKSHEKYR